MFQKLISLVAASSLVLLLCNTSAAGSKAEKDLNQARKVKAAIAKLGVGPAARVEIKLRDKTKLKGYIHEIGENDFVVSELKTGTLSTVAYPQVTQVKGNNLSTGAKIAIGVGVVALLVLFAWAVGDEPVSR
jgi:hypothetical protein